MNILALLHPSARRSVFSLGAQRVAATVEPLRAASSSSTSDEAIESADASEPTAARSPPRPRRRRLLSKNCRSQRRSQQRARSQQQQLLQPNQQDGDQQARLETDVERMRRQIAALDRRLTLLDSVALVSRQNAQNAALRMMERYHAFTCRGYVNARDAATTAFMQSLFVDDVRCPDFTGLRVFLQQWEQLSLYHASIRVDTHGLEVLPCETLVAEDHHGASRYSDDVYVIRSFGTTTCRISRQTIASIFPHVLQDESLVQWLVGKAYAFSYTMVMHVNAEGRIFQFESKVDLTSALLDLLHDPFVTIKMIEASTMTRGGNLQLQREVREAQNTIENGFL